MKTDWTSTLPGNRTTGDAPTGGVAGDMNLVKAALSEIRNFVPNSASDLGAASSGHTHTGGGSSDNVISGLNGNNSADNSTAFSNAYAALAAGRVSYPSVNSNQMGTKIYDIPAGTYVVTSPGALMSDLGIPRTMGLTIRGAGRNLTNIVFSPGTANQYLMNNNEDWGHITFEDLTFVSTVPTASFMRSYSDGGPQNYIFNRVTWDGTWKYGVHMIGTNVNSEMTWYSCGIYGNWTAFLYSGTDGSDQFLNYNFYATNCETATGNFIDMATGGDINIWGGSWIHIGNSTESASSQQTFLKLRGGDHASGVQRVFVCGTRIEHRHVNSTIIDCEWKRGSVLMESIDSESHQDLLTNPNNIVAAKFGVNGDTTPIITWQSCMLMGRHQYSYDNNVWQYGRRIVYRDCEIDGYVRAEDFLIITPTGSPANVGGRPVPVFTGCRTRNAGTSAYLEPFDCSPGWNLATNGVPQQLSVTIKLPNSQVPRVGDATWQVNLPLGAIITKVRCGKPAGGSSTSTTYQYALRDADSNLIATASGAAAWNAGFVYASSDLGHICSTDNRRSLTLTATGVSEGSTSMYFIIDYYA